MSNSSNSPTERRLTALSIEDLAMILKHNGCPDITPDDVRDDIARGAPTNADGTINFIDYAAWLVLKLREMEGGD